MGITHNYHIIKNLKGKFNPLQNNFKFFLFCLLKINSIFFFFFEQKILLCKVISLNNLISQSDRKTIFLEIWSV